VIVLDDSNYESLLLKSEEPWLVEIYAPWCGHCKSLQPKYDQLPGKVQGCKVND